MEIQKYNSNHLNGVRDLIIPIQREEFGIEITYEDQPDLADVENFYQQGKGGFWVAVVGDQLVGSIALIDIGNDQLALRKMFVAKAYRGPTYGLAKKLLDYAANHARDQDVKDIHLGTTDAFKAAHRFYEKNGFELVDESNLPEAFPKMSQDTRFYRMKF